MDLALSNLQRLISHTTQQQTNKNCLYIYIYIYISVCFFKITAYSYFCLKTFNTVDFAKIWPSQLGLKNTPTTLQHRGKPPTMSVLFMTKQFDGEASLMLELWGMQSTSSLFLLPGLLWSGEVAPDRVLSMGQIELFVI